MKRSPDLISARPATGFAGMALALLLAGCGGGGGGSAPVIAPVTPPTPTPVTPEPSCVVRIVADTSIEAGKAGGATVQSCSGKALADISWSQVSGPAVDLLAARSPTVSFEPAAAGTVVLRADVTLADGSAGQASTSVPVSAAPTASFLTIRLDHSVAGGTDTSVRAWPTLRNGETVSSISWTQLSGPSVKMDTTDNRLMTFTAPAVDSDTVLTFRATLTTSSGRQDSDDVMIGVEHQAASPKDGQFDVVARVHPYSVMGQYASKLQRCVYDIGLYYTDPQHTTFCTAGTLPLLSAEAGVANGNVPTVEQVMGRVLVSHDFLGANFERFLRTQDTNGDFRRLLASVTSVVIGSHVRPSFYTAATGAIYLDANNLWLTPQERDVVTEVPDYRLAYDVDLNYSSYGRAVKNNDYASYSYSSTSRASTRTIDELVFGIGRLMYHELGHASDYFPPSQRELSSNKTIWDNAVDRVGAITLPSDRLAQTYPLRSREMFGLAQVSFWGAKATEEQIGYGPDEVGSFFSGDRATDDYAYSRFESENSREDLAMLLEEFMMTYRQGVQFDIAFGNKYQSGMTGADVIVAWGQRGRIADPAVKPRIKLVLQQVAPWIDPQVVESLPTPLLMRSGASWNSNLTLGSATAGGGARSIGPRDATSAPAQQLRDDAKRPRAQSRLHR